VFLDGYSQGLERLVGEDRVKVAGKNCGLVELFAAIGSYAVGRRLIEDWVETSNKVMRNEATKLNSHELSPEME
jgi:hypothetical protein